MPSTTDGASSAPTLRKASHWPVWQISGRSSRLTGLDEAVGACARQWGPWTCRRILRVGGSEGVDAGALNHRHEEQRIPASSDSTTRPDAPHNLARVLEDAAGSRAAADRRPLRRADGAARDVVGEVGLSVRIRAVDASLRQIQRHRRGRGRLQQRERSDSRSQEAERNQRSAHCAALWQARPYGQRHAANSSWIECAGTGLLNQGRDGSHRASACPRSCKVCRVA